MFSTMPAARIPGPIAQSAMAMLHFRQRFKHHPLTARREQGSGLRRSEEVIDHLTTYYFGNFYLRCFFLVVL
jgi:hypothetical protein